MPKCAKPAMSITKPNDAKPTDKTSGSGCSKLCSSTELPRCRGSRANKLESKHRRFFNGTRSPECAKLGAGTAKATRTNDLTGSNRFRSAKAKADGVVSTGQRPVAGRLASNWAKLCKGEGEPSLVLPTMSEEESSLPGLLMAGKASMLVLQSTKTAGPE